MALVRLNKYLKDQNICSRRKADEFISMGYVLVNNIIITELGTMIDPEVDRVTVSNNLHKVINSFRYILLNKPINYVCSKNRNEGKLIFDLLPQIKDLTYAGRLDKDSHGLIILSNDGRFVYKVAGSEFEVEKEYLVRVDKPITSQFILRHTNSSIRLDGKLLKPAKIHIINQFVYKITLTEGVNRQIRRMAEALSYKVLDLKRIRIAHITDKNLAIAKWRYLTQDEIKKFSL